MKTADAVLSSLDRQYSCRARLAAPDRYRWLLSLPRDGRYIPRGAGISYVAASFDPQTVSIGMKSFDRILAFDESSRTIDVEAGVPLSKLYDFLSPKNLYLPIQPGHPQITVGGCIAFNIHGKNQFREGLFDACVEELDLFHPAKGLLRLSPRQDAELFALTCGGFGLTGIIVRARLRLRKIPAPMLLTCNVPTLSLRETFEKIDQLKDHNDMLYSWNDLSRPGVSSGAGFIACGRFAEGPARSCRAPARRVIDSQKAAPAFSLYNKISLPLLNAGYRLLQTTLKRRGAISFYAFTYPVVDKTFYFDLFGRAGFVERQILVPNERRWDYLDAIEKLVARHKPRIALATVKVFKGRRRLLNYDGDGLSLSLDLVGGDDESFHESLDGLNIELGALDNPAKDSRLTAAVLAREYPEHGLFKDRLRAFDPDRLFRSEMSQRLEL